MIPPAAKFEPGGHTGAAPITINGFSFDAMALEQLLVRVFWKQAAAVHLDTWDGCEQAAKVTTDWPGWGQ